MKEDACAKLRSVRAATIGFELRVCRSRMRDIRESESKPNRPKVLLRDDDLSGHVKMFPHGKTERGWEGDMRLADSNRLDQVANERKRRNGINLGEIIGAKL